MAKRKANQLYKPRQPKAEEQALWNKLLPKRGVAAWISWVLLVGLMVVIGFFVLNWAKGLVLRQGGELTMRAEHASVCQSLDLRVDDICQNTQTLNINVTNNNKLKIESLVIRMVDIYGGPQLREINVTIRPEEKKQIKIVKQGMIQHMEIMPGSFKGSERILCQNKGVVQEDVKVC